MQQCGKLPSATALLQVLVGVHAHQVAWTSFRERATRSWTHPVMIMPRLVVCHAWHGDSVHSSSELRRRHRRCRSRHRRCWSCDACLGHTFIFLVSRLIGSHAQCIGPIHTLTRHGPVLCMRVRYSTAVDEHDGYRANDCALLPGCTMTEAKKTAKGRCAKANSGRCLTAKKCRFLGSVAQWETPLQPFRHRTGHGPVGQTACACRGALRALLFL